MGKREDHRRLQRLAEMQGLAREQRRHELGQTCEATDVRVRAEARSMAEHDAGAAALEATFAAPRLCVDRLALAVRRLHASEAVLAEDRQAAAAARLAEDGARKDLHEADHRARMVGTIARKLQRKLADKRENEAVLQTVAIKLSRGERR